MLSTASLGLSLAHCTKLILHISHIIMLGLILVHLLINPFNMSLFQEGSIAH